jgi:hypothetical protein
VLRIAPICYGVCVLTCPIRGRARSHTSKQLPAEMTGLQRVPSNSSPVPRDSYFAGADNKASTPKYKTLHRASSSCGSHDDLYGPQASRVHQLRMQIDPRGHLLDVLDMRSPLNKMQKESEQSGESPTIKAGTPHNLRAPPTLSRSNKMRDVNRLALVEEMTPMEKSPASVGSPDASSHDRPSGAPPLWGSFSEPRMPRRWANRARSSPDARPSWPPPPSERIRVSWLPLARSFTNEFFPERPQPPLPPLPASVPSLPRSVLLETSSVLERSSKTNRLREIATKLLPRRMR